MNTATLESFRQIASDMGINPFPETTSELFRVEYQARGGDWGSVRVSATNATEAESKVNASSFSHASQPMARATHKLSDAGTWIRI